MEDLKNNIDSQLTNIIESVLLFSEKKSEHKADSLILNKSDSKYNSDIFLNKEKHGFSLEITISDFDDCIIKEKNSKNFEFSFDIIGHILSFLQITIDNFDDCIQWFIIAHNIKTIRKDVASHIIDFFGLNNKIYISYDGLTKNLFTKIIYKSDIFTVFKNQFYDITRISKKEALFIFEIIKIIADCDDLHCAYNAITLLFNHIEEYSITHYEYYLIILLATIRYRKEYHPSKYIDKIYFIELCNYFPKNDRRHIKLLILKEYRKHNKLIFAIPRSIDEIDQHIYKYIFNETKECIRSYNFPQGIFIVLRQPNIIFKEKINTKKSMTRTNNRIQYKNKQNNHLLRNYKRKF